MLRIQTNAQTLDSSNAATAYFGGMFEGEEKETLHVVHLDEGRRVVGNSVHRSSSAEAVPFPIRLIVTDALAFDAHCVILAHNHPSGSSVPSAVDILATRTLINVANPMGIKLLDHLIFADRNYVSLRSLGLL